MNHLKLAIIISHPIQYNAPVFKEIANNPSIQLKVFYTWGEECLSNKFDPGFGKVIKWDIPLLEGYEYTFEKNISKKPGTHHFWGINNPSLLKDIETWEANAILIYGWSFISHLRVLLSFKGKIPIFFRGDSNLLDEKKNIKTIFRRISLKFIFRYVNYAFYVGSENKKYYLKHGLKEKQLIWAPHCVDNKFFQLNRTEESNKLAKNLDISENDIVILFVGKLEPKKNPIFLLKVFNKSNNKNLHLIFTGSGKLETELKQMAKENKNVHFLGFQNQSVMPSIYYVCDVLCLPSKGPGETWGLTINEAMACGKAIIASNKVGCANDLIKNNYNGYVFDINDENAFNKIIEKELNKEKLKIMGQNSLKIISDWTIQKTVNILTTTILEKCEFYL